MKLTVTIILIYSCTFNAKFFLAEVEDPNTDEYLLSTYNIQLTCFVSTVQCSFMHTCGIHSPHVFVAWIRIFFHHFSYLLTCYFKKWCKWLGFSGQSSWVSYVSKVGWFIHVFFFIFRIGYVYEEYGGDYSDKREEEHDYMQFGMHKETFFWILLNTLLTRHSREEWSK